MSKNSALVIGCTGLVGASLVDTLLESTHYDRIKLVARRPLNIEDDRVEEIIIPDFDQLDEYSDKLEANDYFCCLGTTIKKAGSKEMFRKVDLEYPLKLAAIGKRTSGFRQFLIVTAAGSNANSPLFYNKVKGEVEEKLQKMKLPSLFIFRPSLLLGDRSEFRFGEEAAKALTSFLSFFMVGLKRKLWAIKASDVAKSMFLVAHDQLKGNKVFSSSDMLDKIKLKGF